MHYLHFMNSALTKNSSRKKALNKKKKISMENQNEWLSSDEFVLQLMS